jgi:hypothetical protein
VRDSDAVGWGRRRSQAAATAGTGWV